MLAASLLAIGLAVAGLTFSFLTYWIGAPLVSLLWNSHSPSISSLILAPIFALAFAGAAFFCLYYAWRIFWH